MDFPVLACGWAVTTGNRPPFCLPLPSSTRTHSCTIKGRGPFFRLPIPQLAVALWRFPWRREGHSCVIVMQQGSAAWDDVNETAFSDEKLLWHILKDKSPHSEKTILKVFIFFSPCWFGLLVFTKRWGFPFCFIANECFFFSYQHGVDSTPLTFQMATLSVLSQASMLKRLLTLSSTVFLPFFTDLENTQTEFFDPWELLHFLCEWLTALYALNWRHPVDLMVQFLQTHLHGCL